MIRGSKLFRITLHDAVNEVLYMRQHPSDDPYELDDFREWLDEDEFELACDLAGLDYIPMAKLFRLMLTKPIEEAKDLGRRFRRQIMSHDICEAELDQNIVFGRKVSWQVKRKKEATENEVSRPARRG